TGAQLQRQEIREELLAGVGEDRFRVELNAFDLVAAVAQAHDNAVIGFRGDRELARQRLPFHNERVIAGGRERVGQLAEDIFPVVMNLAGFTMEKFRSADDFSAKSCTNGLVAEANTEDWKFSGKTGDELDGNARFPRRARSGRNEIGRASCRERGEIVEGAGGVERKNEKQQTKRVVQREENKERS